MKNSILELINVSLPVRAVHDEGECSEEMLDLIDEYVVNSEEQFDDEFYDELDDELTEEDAEDEESGEIDPRWDALKKLKK